MENPYAPPTRDGVDSGSEAADIRLGKSRVLITLLLIGLAFRVLITLIDIAGMLQFTTWNDMDADLQGNAELIMITAMSLGGVAYLFVFVATVVFFCIWIHRANRNARALGARWMKFTPASSVGWWFVPFANLFKPYQAVKEVFQASNPERGSLDWKKTVVPATFGIWWSAWIAGNMISNMSMRMSFSDDPATVAAGSWVGLAEAALMIPACFAIVKIIRTIDAWQLAKSALPPALADESL